jgi:RNA polymerase sigma-70 factor (ECF subfamily)
MTDASAERLLADTAWLRNLTRRLVGGDLAADLQQDLAMAALRQPKAAATGRSWLARVARNLATSLRRRRAAERRRIDALPPREPVPSPAELVATAELQQRAVAAVLSLPIEQRDTILLRFLHGLGVAATAAAMGVPEETVRTRQRRALARLRAQLAPERGPRSIAALLDSLLALGAAVNGKPVVVGAVALLLIASLAVVPWSGAPPTPASTTAGVAPAVAAMAAASAAHSGAVTDVGPSSTRTELAPDVAAPVPAELVVRLFGDGTVAGVPVLCHRSFEPGRFVRTDDGGYARFPSLPAGDYLIVLPNWVSETVSLAAGDQKVAEMLVHGGRTVTGIVLGPRDAPAAGTEIEVSAAGVEPAWRFAAGRTDAQGHFTVAGLRDGSMVGARDARLGTSDFHMLGAEPKNEPHDGPPPLVLRLPGTAAVLRGRVAQADGAGVAGCWVQIGTFSGRMERDEHGDLVFAPPAALATTDADGRFAADALPVGRTVVTIAHKGFAPLREDVTLADGAAVERGFVLRAGGSLTGRVVDPAGLPVGGAEVRHLLGRDHPAPYSAATDADGRFAFGDLAAGEHEFEVLAPDRPRERRRFRLATGEALVWDVALRDSPMIRARLVDGARTPIRGWWVMVRGSNQSHRTDDNGCCVLPEAGPADNTLLVRDRVGFAPVILFVEHVAPDAAEQTFVVDAEHLPSAWLHGRVLDAQSAPLAGAILDLEQDGLPLYVPDARASAADGTFAIGPLPPGRYRVMPAHRDCVFVAADAELAPRQHCDLGDRRGVTPAKLVVRLTGDAFAVERAVVQLVDGVDRHTAVGEHDVRRFSRVLPRAYRLVVRVDDREQDCGEIALAPGDDVERSVAVR